MMFMLFNREPEQLPMETGYGAHCHPLDNEVWFLWERLSASIIAAGKPLPQEKVDLLSSHQHSST
jgi:hypothetical protein